MEVVTLKVTVADQTQELDILCREVAPHDEDLKELRKGLAELKDEVGYMRNKQGGSGHQSLPGRQARRSPVPQLKKVGPGPRRVVSPDRGLSQTMHRIRRNLKKL